MIEGDRQAFYSTHTFDLYITYDKFYQTARMWISGFDKVQSFFFRVSSITGFLERISNAP